jgi:hypothetical protein
MSSLSPNTSYYARAYACNTQGYAYGNQITVSTLNLKEVNLCRNLCVGTDGVSHSTTRQHYLYTTPAMSPGDSYCACLYIPKGLAVSLLSTGSYASGGVTCNASTLCFACITNQACCNAQLSFPVNYGDQVLISDFTCATTLGCGGANSCVCIGSITSISGNFALGTTCCKSYTHTG